MRLDEQKGCQQRRAAPSSPSDCNEVQPAALPLTMAYTASISDAVMVTAPDM